MKKLLLSAAVTAALFSGHASAVIPTIVGPVSATQQVDFSATTGVNLAANVQAAAYFSGSSAANPFLEASIIQAAAANKAAVSAKPFGKCFTTSAGLNPFRGRVDNEGEFLII